MIIYADILFLLNLYINFLLLQSVKKIAGADAKLPRLIIASLVGAALAFTIFLEIGFVVGVFVRIISCTLITFAAFGFHNLKKFLRLSASLFGVTFAFAGIVAAIWAIFEPHGLAVTHGVVYYDVSALILIISTLAAYFVLAFIKKIMHKKLNLSKFYKINFTLNSHEITLRALLDSGNALSDPFSDKPIIIISTTQIEHLLPNEIIQYIHHKTSVSNKEEPLGIRLIPYHAIKGEGLLPAITTTNVIISPCNSKNNEETFYIKSALVAFVTRNLGNDYNAIINEEILQKGDEMHATKIQKIYRNARKTAIK